MELMEMMQQYQSTGMMAPLTRGICVGHMGEMLDCNDVDGCDGCTPDTESGDC